MNNTSVALPIQIRVLIPVKRSERSLRVLRLMRNYYPEISSEIMLLHVLEKPDRKSELEALQDINGFVSEYLPEFRVQILVKSGKFLSVLRKTTLNHRIDLIIIPLPPVWRSFRIFRENPADRFIRSLRTPILFLTDPNRGFNTPVRRVHIHVNPKAKSRIAPAFALRTARLLNSEILLSACARQSMHTGTCRKLEFLTERYLDEAALEKTSISVQSGSVFKHCQNIRREFQPDLMIFCIQDYGYFKLAEFLRTLNAYSMDCFIPILVVRRLEGLKYLERRYGMIHKNLSDYDLTFDEPQVKLPDGSELEHPSGPGSNKLLGYYTARGIKKALTKYGIISDLERIGYPDVVVDLGAVDRFRQRLRIFPNSKHDSEPLLDMVVKRELTSTLVERFPDFPRACEHYILIEWLCLQDSRRAFQSHQCPLPGQKFPGLGMGWKVLVLLEFMARRIRSAGLCNIPEYYHSGRFFHRFFRFVSPISEGELLALDRDTFPLHVVDVSWSIIHDLVKRGDKLFKWSGSPQIFPISPHLKSYFRADAYKTAMRKSLIENRFVLDNLKVDKMRADGTFYVVREKFSEAE